MQLRLQSPKEEAKRHVRLDRSLLPRGRLFETSNLVFFASVVILLLFLVIPLYQVLRRSVFDASGALTFQHFGDIIFDPFRSVPMINSLWVSGSVTLVSLAISIPLAFLLSQTDIPFKSTFAALLLMPYILPSPFISMAWITSFTSNGLLEQIFGIESVIPAYGPIALIAVQAIHLFPLAFLTILGAWTNLGSDPVAAARVHGASSFREFYTVSVPILTPAIVNGAILVFALALAEFGPPLLLGGPVGFRVMTTQIYSQVASHPINFNLAAAMALVLAGVSFVALFSGRFIFGRRSYVTTGGKSTPKRLLKLGRWKAPALGLVLLSIGTVLVAPLLAGLVTATMDTWGRGYGFHNATVRWFGLVWESARSREALTNVIVLGAAAAVITATLGLVYAYFAIRRKGWQGRLVDAVVFMPYVVPGIVIAVGLILAFGGRSWLPLAGTKFILLVAYCLRFMPIAFRQAHSGLLQLGPELEEASRVTGGNWARTLMRITVPLVKGSLLGGMVLVFVSTLKEVASSILLWSPGSEVAPVLAVNLFSDGNIQQALALNLTLAVLGTGLAWFFMRRTTGAQLSSVEDQERLL